MDVRRSSNGLSPYVMQELSKVTMDIDFHKNSIDIFNHLISSEESFTTDFVFDENELENNQQNLDLPESSQLNIFEEEEGNLFNQSYICTTKKNEEISGDEYPTHKVTCDRHERETRSYSIEEDKDYNEGTKISIKLPEFEQQVSPKSETKDVLNKNLRPRDDESSPNMEVRRLTSNQLPTVQVINSHNLKRNDVIIKSILRAVKRYYRTKFHEVTGCKKPSSNISATSDDETLDTKKTNLESVFKQIDVKNGNLVKSANEVVQAIGLDQFSENMDFYFLSLSFPNEAMKVLQDAKNKFSLKPKAKDYIQSINQGIATIKLIDSAMNRFSKKVFKNFMEIMEISHLVQHFLTNNSEHLARIEGFANCVDLMGSKSSEVIAAQEQEGHTLQAKNHPYYMKKKLFFFHKA